jgi:hypothetical protein
MNEYGCICTKVDDEVVVSADTTYAAQGIAFDILSRKYPRKTSLRRSDISVYLISENGNVYTQPTIIF